MSRCIALLLICGVMLGSLMPYAYSYPNLEARLSVNIAEDRAHLHIVYEVKNLTANLIGPDPSDAYHFTIRNVATGEEVIQGTLDSALQTNVSQYASPYAHAVFAVKRVPIPDSMKNNPGFYLIFLNVGHNILGEETVFYIPANLQNPDPALQRITRLLRDVRNIVKQIKALVENVLAR